MITGTSYFFDRNRDRMSSLNGVADRLQTAIASGKQLATASDDSAAWQRLQGLVQTKADTGAFTGNITLARAVLAQTDSALGTIQTQLQRASELAIRANSGTMSTEQRAIVATELDAIVADLTALGNAKDARGELLFDANAATIPVTDGVAIVANEDGTRVFGTILASLTDYAATLRTADAAGATAASATAIAALKGATDNVATIQGVVGARAARLELISTATQTAAGITEVQRSAIEDTDYTVAIADLQKTMTILQATQASFAKLTELSIFNYIR